MSIKIEKTKFDGVYIIKEHVYNDFRGYYIKSFEKEDFIKNGINVDIYECSDIVSKKGVLRGLHYQDYNPQGKLIRVISGEIFDVILDLRLNSKTFGKYMTFRIKSSDNISVLIPPGFAHGFLSLKEDTVFSYLSTNVYNQQTSNSIRWNDEFLNIPWPINEVDEVILTDKDKNGELFTEYLKRNN